MRLLQLVHGQVHRASPAVCHHVAVSCGGEREHTLLACFAPSALRPFQVHPAPSPAPVASLACGEDGGGVAVRDFRCLNLTPMGTGVRFWRKMFPVLCNSIRGESPEVGVRGAAEWVGGAGNHETARLGAANGGGGSAFLRSEPHFANVPMPPISI